jgi:ADP-heptose:LPS heptosyltransferase
MERALVIIHPGSLGDVLLAVPAIKLLRARFPQHRALLISNKSVGRFLLDVRMIDAWMSVQGAACTDLFAGSVPDSSELGRWFEECDLVVAWINDEEKTFATTLRCCGVSEMRVQSPFSSDLKATHQSDRFLETIGESPADISVEVRMPIPSDLREREQACLDRLGISSDRSIVLIHPGSGSPRKCVTPEVLVALIERFRQESIDPVLLEGPADREAVSSLVKLTPTAPTVLGGLDLSTVACLLDRTHVYIGHDSGITHLSGLLGVPTVALFGPTDHNRWMPRGSHVAVLRRRPCICPSWECVSACAEKPCFISSAEEILAAAKKIGRWSDTTPRNLSRCALSQPDPCATVPR